MEGSVAVGITVKAGRWLNGCVCVCARARVCVSKHVYHFNLKPTTANVSDWQIGHYIASVCLHNPPGLY